MATARRFVLAMALLWTAACSSTRIVDTWKAPNYEGPPMKSLLVCGVHPDETTRRIYEDTFVQELQQRGIEAKACYLVLAGNTRPTEQELREAVAKAGVDGVILTRLARVSERTSYVPGGFYGAAPFFYGGGFYPAYYSSIGFAYSPGYYTSDTIVQLLTQVYENKDNNELVWSGTSQTTDPDSAKGLVKSVVPKFIDELTEAKILPKPPKT